MHHDGTRVPRIPRRGFLKAAALAAAPMILPSGAFGRGAQPGANNKIVTGHIGLGPRGRFLLDRIRDNAGAVCDVDDARLAQGAALTNPGTRTHTDYRELLARNDIDAVVIASPDHWHAVHAVHACETGKDVYIEMPVCRSPIAGRKLIRAAARSGAMVQTGSMARHTPSFAAMQLALKDLGAVSEVNVWGSANPLGGTEAQSPPPDSLRWEQWLGPAPWRPYAAAFVEDGWRWHLDFGGGQIMRQGAELLECALAVLDVGLDANVKVTTNGQSPTAGLFDCPQPFEAVFEISKPAVKITWSQNPPEGTRSPSLEIHGANGTLNAHGQGLDFAVDAAVLEKLPEPDRGKEPAPLDLWLQSVAKRVHPMSTLAHGVLAGSLAALANLSFRIGRPLAWDGTAGTCTNDDMANRMLAEPGSGPWRI